MKKILSMAFAMLMCATCIAQQNIKTFTFKKGDKWQDYTNEEEMMELDSVIIKGYFTADLFWGLSSMTNDGRLMGIDMSECTIENDEIPFHAFVSRNVNGVSSTEDDDEYMHWHGISKLRHIVFPQTLQRIADGAFMYNFFLEEIDIPRNVREIRDRAFYDCSKLRRVRVHTSDPNIAENKSVFYKMATDAVLYVPNGSKEAYAQHVAWGDFNTILEYDDDLSGISYKAFDATYQKKNEKTYTLDGRYLGSDIKALKSGIYVVNGKKVVK